jgi:hypothetical protein
MRPQPLVLCIDEYLWREFAKDAREKNELLRLTGLQRQDVEEGQPPNWWYLLTLPIDGVRHYWKRAAQQCLEEINDSDSELVFVAFHALYQSDHYRWRLSAVDPTVLTEFGFKSILTLIDDVYDIHRRRTTDLIAERMLVKGHEGDGYSKASKLVEQTVYYLEQFILWRQEEIVLTDLFAATCSVPAHVFAIKHPMRTLQRLIDEPGNSSYFSHPISGVRTQENFPSSQDFVEINEFSKTLRSHITLIEPTTIDELRIVKVKSGTSIRYLPQLSSRWPLLLDSSELASASLSQFYDPLESSVFSESNARDLGLDQTFQTLQDAPEQILNSISSALQQLSDTITQDITWRDHYLVDQTKGLIVYQPMQKGRMSFGVKRELEYYAKLSLTGAQTKGCIIYHPDEDRHLRAVATAEELFNTWGAPEGIAKHVQPALASLGDRRADLITALSTEILTIKDAAIGASRVVKILEDFVNIEPQISPNLPMGEGTSYRAKKRIEEVRQLAVKIAEEVIEREFYVDLMKDTPELNLTFVKKNTEILDSLNSLRTFGPNKEKPDVNI